MGIVLSFFMFFTKKKIVVAGLAVLLAACSSPNEGRTVIFPTEPMAATATSVGEAIPNVLVENQEAFAEVGYRSTQQGEGWQLLDENNDNKEIFRVENGEIILIDKNGVEQRFSEAAYEMREVMGVDIKQIDTIDNEQGEVLLYYLRNRLEKGEDYWVAPLEIQTNPEVIADYPAVEPDVFWTGEALFSELLSAEPFPDDAAIPGGFYLHGTGMINFTDTVTLKAFITVQHDEEGNLINSFEIPASGQDYQRWKNYYLSHTPSGEEFIVAAKQVRFTDGQASVFLHQGFGHEWPWERDYQNDYEGEFNLIDTIFLDQTVIADPLIAVAWVKYDGAEDLLLSLLRGEDLPVIPVKKFYKLSENNPALVGNIQAEIDEATQRRGNGIPFFGPFAELTSEELIQMQTIIFLSNWSR
jgi:hypothetical protein